MELIKIKNYKIKIDEKLKYQVINNRYFRERVVDVVHINQCPICGFTNVNMDPYIMGCIGAKYVYLRHNKTDNHRIIHIDDPERSVEYYMQHKTSAYHSVTEMHQKIVHIKNVNRIRVNSKEQ